MKHDPFRSIADELAQLEGGGLLRRPAVRGPLHVMCSNDYLGLGARVEHVAGPTGAGASPLVSGYTEVHETAARALAEWLRCERVTLFTSGYAANVGVLQALGGEGVVLFSDALNHASIIDGCRLSRARVEVVPHLDLEALERALHQTAPSAKARWVVTESYFSMDGDSPDLVGLRALCDRHGAGLILDEAHALGVFGPGGRGLAAAVDVQADVVVGTLGKSFGLHGAFVGGRATLQTLLWNRARSLVFSTAGSPLVLGLVPDRVREVAGADELRRHLELRSTSLRRVLSELAARLSRAGQVRVLGHGPIAPLVVGDVQRAIELSEQIASAGYLVKPMRPPTVPEHASRLRFTATMGASPALTESFEATLASLA